MPSKSFPVYLRTLPSGFVSVDSSKNSVHNFFASEVPSISKTIFPKFIHIAMNERIKLCYNEIDARNIFEECPHFSHRLHKFIRTNSNCTSKLRVHWKIFKPPIGYIVSNKLQIVPTSEKKIKNNANDSVSEKKNSEKSSFKSLPFLSKNKDQNLSKSFLDVSKYTLYNEDLKNDDYRKYIVQVQSTYENYITISNRFIPELQDSFKEIVKIVNFTFLKNPNLLQELLLDFVKDSNQKWVFLNCKGHKIKGDVKAIKLKSVNSVQSLNEKSLSRNPSINICESVSEESLTSDVSSVSSQDSEKIDKLSRKFKFLALEMEKSPAQNSQFLHHKEYLKSKQCDELGRVPHLMIGVMPHKFENPITYFIDKNKEPPIKPTKHKDRAKNLHWIGSDKLNPENYSELISKNLNNINSTYNKHRYEAKVGRMYLSTKSKIIEIMIRNSKNIQLGIELFLGNIEKNNSYCRFFQNRTQQELLYISLGIFNSLNPVSEMNLRESLVKSHQGLEINTEIFMEFVDNLVSSVKYKACLQDHEADVILTRLRSFEKDIISK